MQTPLIPARSELILGGQRSGKSRRAEQLASAWLASAPTHRAVFIATAQGADEEMRLRIARHQADRAQRVPGMTLVEPSLPLAGTLTQYSRPDTLLVVDCLTLWLTQLLMPAPPLKENPPDHPEYQLMHTRLLLALKAAPGPVILVSNEIGMGVVPMGAPVRAFVDELGRLNQRVAASCARVTLMVAGLPLTLKDTP